MSEPNGTGQIPIVVYGCKSSPDEKGSVADQHRLVLDSIDREGDREVVGTFGEENESGYRKSRGPELEAAMRLAVALADEGQEVELWIWHPSRLARGSGKKGEAQSLMERVTYLRRHGVTVRSLERDDMLDRPVLLGVEDEQSTTYSQNLGTWVKAGMARRKAAGKPVGSLPFGYMVEKKIVHGDVLTRRVPDPKTGPLRVELLERIAAEASPGSVAR
jgi:DNA invertase Pin-like site-specific DNA recombinase